MIAYHFILRARVAPISTFRLLSTHAHTHTHIYISSPTLPIVSHMNPHCRLCSLIHNTPPTSAPHFLKGCPFSPPNPREPGRKRAPPAELYLLLSISTPISVAAMSTSPHEVNLCLMLPHHFLLRAKSLPGPTLTAPPKPEAGFCPLPSQVYIYIHTYSISKSKDPTILKSISRLLWMFLRLAICKRWSAETVLPTSASPEIVWKSLDV